MCLILHKVHSKSEAVKPILNLRFVTCFLNLNVEQIISVNQSIESSLCLVLKILMEHNFFHKNEAHRLFGLFKVFSLKLLGAISDNPRILFNTLRIISQLQEKRVITPSEYTKYQIRESIQNKMMRLREESSIIYQLGYNILLDIEEDIYRVY